MGKREKLKRYDLYYKDYDEYMIEIVKETIARQLASYYNFDLLGENETLRQYVGSIMDAFNICFKFEDIREDVEKLLKEKYSLVILTDEPLTMKSLK